MRQVEQSPPFRDRIGSHLGGSWHTDIHALGERHVLRTIRQRWKILGGFVGSDWKEDFLEGYLAMRDFLGPQMVPTYLVEGLNHDGKPDLLIVHERIEGRPLKDIGYHEIIGNPHIFGQLEDLTVGIQLMYEETGRMPDIHGTPQLTHQYDTKRTDAIIVDEEGRVWLRDIETIGPLWSPHWALGRAHMKKHIDSLNQFRIHLGLDDLRKERQFDAQRQLRSLLADVRMRKGANLDLSKRPLLVSSEIWPHYKDLIPPITVVVGGGTIALYSQKGHMTTLMLRITTEGLEVGEGLQTGARIFRPKGNEKEAFLQLGIDIARYLLKEDY